VQILTQVVQQKFEHQWGWHTFEQRFNRDERLEKLQALQQALLLNGFRHLREGGTLVYSTCSASKKQNEDVVQWLLNTQPGACLLPLTPMPLCAHTGDSRDKTSGDEWAGGCHALGGGGMAYKAGLGELMSHVARFDPATSGSSGMFVARLSKRPSAPLHPRPTP
jgi:16S rRNA C967 or C1407 C5-methylase (RsmB/RsmF family)